MLASRSGDIAFHMNPRVKDDVVVRNSMMGGHWGHEERQLGDNPFKEGQYFDVSLEQNGVLETLGVCESDTSKETFGNNFWTTYNENALF